MKFKIISALFLLMVFMYSCSPVKVTGITSSDQKVFEDESVISEKKHAVTMSHYTKIEEAEDKTIFKIIVENRGEEPVKISEDNISVIFEESGEKKALKKIELQPFDNFMKDLEREYYSEELTLELRVLRDMEWTLLMIAAAPLPENADMGELAYNMEKALGEEFEPQFREMNETIEDLHEDIKQLREVLPEIIMKPKTIKPGDVIIAIFICDTRDMDKKVKGNFKIKFFVDSEEHRFTFARR